MDAGCQSVARSRLCLCLHLREGAQTDGRRFLSPGPLASPVSLLGGFGFFLGVSKLISVLLVVASNFSLLPNVIAPFSTPRGTAFTVTSQVPG